MSSLVVTKLDAVNTMLSGIGETPVNSLLGELPADVAVALSTLDEVVHEIQLRGWNFNTEENYELTPSSSGEIWLAPNMIRVSLLDPDSNDVVIRGQRLYDRVGHTYLFNSPVQATVTLLLSFEELPAAFRWYAIVRAARRFQDRTVGAEGLHAFQAQDEAESRVQAAQEDMEIGRHSMVKGEAVTFLSGWKIGDVLKR